MDTEFLSNLHHTIESSSQNRLQSRVTVRRDEVIGDHDLQEFVSTKLTWEVIDNMAHQIFIESFAGNNFNDLRDQPDSECDKRRENQLLFNRDGLMYVLLAQASNNGAIGLMRDLLWVWVLMFQACGKHKYATHLSKFLRDLWATYPARLSHTIEMHWLCNPTGTPEWFRGVDWWVELNNLYTKVGQCECHTK